MGKTALPFASLSTTMGMFVTGSIIRPRIFISTSIGASHWHKPQPVFESVPHPFPPRTDENSLTSDVLTQQTIRSGARHANVHVCAQQVLLQRTEIQNTM